MLRTTSPPGGVLRVEPGAGADHTSAPADAVPLAGGCTSELARARVVGARGAAVRSPSHAWLECAAETLLLRRRVVRVVRDTLLGAVRARGSARRVRSRVVSVRGALPSRARSTTRMLAVSDPGDAEGPGDSLCSAEDAVDRLSCDRRLTSERRAVGDRMPEKRDESLSSRAAAGALSSGVRGYAAVPVARLSLSLIHI